MVGGEAHSTLSKVKIIHAALPPDSEELIRSKLTRRRETFRKYIFSFGRPSVYATVGTSEFDHG